MPKVVYNVHVMESNTTQSLIETQVRPLRQFAIDRAVARMSDRIEMVLAKIAAADDDRNAVYPYPSSNMSRNTYRSMEADYNFASRITTWHETKYKTPTRNGPAYVQRDPEGITRVLEQTAIDAAAAYDMYVAKLVAQNRRRHHEGRIDLPILERLG